LRACGKSFEEIRETIMTDNAEAFRDIFNKNAVNFGEYCTKALQETDYLIAAMVSK
jgi:hypothetical protein